MRGPSFTELGEDIGRSFLHKKFVSEFGYLAAFSNTGCSQLSAVENDAKFCTFWPLWKLGEGWTRSLYQLLKRYLWPNRRNTFDGHPLRGCWARWIEKKKRKVSLWVKLNKAIRTRHRKRTQKQWRQGWCGKTVHENGSVIRLLQTIHSSFRRNDARSTINGYIGVGLCCISERTSNEFICLFWSCLG